MTKKRRKEILEHTIETIEFENGWNFTGKGRHCGYTGYWFVDADYIPHWLSSWYVRKYAKEIEERKVFTRDKFFITLREYCSEALQYNYDEYDKELSLDLFENNFYSNLFEDKELEEIWNESLVIDNTITCNEHPSFDILYIFKEHLENKEVK